MAARRGLGTISEPARQTPVIAETDVLVVGGGVAGLAAAVAAARAGAGVVLVERYGYLGGLATGGLIILLLTLDDGRGRQVVGGICQELVQRLEARGAAYYPSRAEWGDADPERIERYRRWGLVWGAGPHVVRYSVAYDPEAFKRAADELISEAGVRLRFHTWATDVVLANERIEAVIVESKAGRGAIRARVVIDATGDGDLFVSAGEPYEKELVHPWLWFRMGNVDAGAERGEARGRFFQTLGEGRVLLPWGSAGRIERRIDATSPEDLTYAEVECRRLVIEEVERLRAEVPGFERAYLADMAVQLGITESRRLLGRYQLGRTDLDERFADVIARTGHWTKYGAIYDIPYRSLLPRRTRNLLVAGRCISVDHRAHHATKEIPPCLATGEAAGAAAALAIGAGRDASELDVTSLQTHLRRQGAILD